MPPNILSTVLDVLTTKKGAALAVPAILLTGAALYVGANPGVPNAGAGPASAIVASAPAPATGVVRAQAGSTFSAAQKKDIEAVIKDYLLNNPDVLLEAQAALEAKLEKQQNERMAGAIKENAAELFKSTSAPVAGNPAGDVTVVEFFDYNCGYCKKAFPDLAKVVEGDKQVRVVLKEFPILSKGSEEAAKVALAARMQGKYWEFHRAMLELPGQANEASALRVAEKAGLDMARVKREMNSAEVRKEIDDTRKLAQKMGIQGTPHFLVGDKVIPGAPENLTEQIVKYVKEVRETGCKAC